jgi:hypothetical protein
VVEVFQQHQGFWLLLVFVLVLVAGYYVVRGVRKVAGFLA